MFDSLAEMVAQAENRGLPLHEIVLQAEMAHSGKPRAQLRSRMKERLDVMRRAADEGVSRPVMSLSGISGGNAYRFWQWLADHEPLTGPILSRAVARAMAVNEVNAGMGCIVATPTAGSAGILPAVLLTLQEARGFDDEALVDALFTAAGIGVVIIRRASVSGAAGGCQAETGSAAAMAAAAATELLGGTPRQAAQAVAITLKNMLGLVCDPVAGLVEVPCVKRNAAGAAQCFIAVDLALAGVESVIPPDEVIDAMASIGRHMDERFKETALGGLAATPTGRRLAQIVLSANPFTVSVGSQSTG
ncbi:MAG: L-serine ammonia-lyase, iron-sulfur-dependent, subunit alpha [Caldilineales bacterium]|nr:L-serine ammonia-lyase, iron-sulfur-dependent, subunit alpha [Caldilineales bacterium]